MNICTVAQRHPSERKSRVSETRGLYIPCLNRRHRAVRVMPKVAPFLRGRQPVENEYSHSDCDAYSRRADGHSQQGFTEKGCSRLGSDQFTRCGGRGDAAAAYSLGIPGPVLLGVLPSVYGYFFIPNYPSDIATVNFDRSGTTVIGKYLLNHSFMMPGLVSVAVSTIVASIISGLIF